MHTNNTTIFKHAMFRDTHENLIQRTTRKISDKRHLRYKSNGLVYMLQSFSFRKFCEREQVYKLSVANYNIQLLNTTKECGFTLKRVRDMIKTYSQNS